MFGCKKKNFKSQQIGLLIRIVAALACRYDELGHTALRTPTISIRAQRPEDLDRTTKAFIQENYIHGHTVPLQLPSLAAGVLRYDHCWHRWIESLELPLLDRNYG